MGLCVLLNVAKQSSLADHLHLALSCRQWPGETLSQGSSFQLRLCQVPLLWLQMGRSLLRDQALAWLWQAGILQLPWALAKPQICFQMPLCW